MCIRDAYDSRHIVDVFIPIDEKPRNQGNNNTLSGRGHGSLPGSLFTGDLHNIAHLKEPVMSCLMKALSTQPTDSLTPYGLSSNVV